MSISFSGKLATKTTKNSRHYTQIIETSVKFSENMAKSSGSGPEGQPAHVNLFQDITGDDSEVTEIESLCVSCEKNGTTRLLPVKIPFYKEVIVSSFSCPHCNYSDNSVMEGEVIQEQGIEFQLNVKEQRDLDRTVVMSETASLKIPELDFEAPYRRQTFGITTIEGVIVKVKEMLQKYLEARKGTDSEEDLAPIAAFIGKVGKLLVVESTFHLIIDDPSGNSFIQNLNAPNIDPELTSTKYNRTPELDVLCGLAPHDDSTNEDNVHDEVLVFPATCYNCSAACETNMKNVQVPHFSEILIMSTVCDTCGWRNNEVKPSGGIATEGVRITLTISSPEDLSRDVVKSATCALEIPELEFELVPSEHSSRFTTIEGLLMNIKTLVNDNPFARGDSADPEVIQKIARFVEKLDSVVAGKSEVHLVLDDPAGNAFVEAMPNFEQDQNLKIERYKRTRAQDEELGITEMKTDNYEEHAKQHE
ncbi:zinc finger protein ZPR1-like [Paramacrobiotus metropolitanus]|uniref:zinc finger protein ZPR1-like n=1 Tax=Paramacrobiotus metropolitanus TaxID=2943436 RepID=UPI002445E7BA|nr:zinc finger protein ZPR1-like [Paramacrobiotus metropolitanus]